MTYRLKFLPSALNEWKRLSPSIRQQFKKKLRERLEVPHNPATRLRGFQNVYKIKLRAAGYRLVYDVSDIEVTVCVIAVGKRERGLIDCAAQVSGKNRTDFILDAARRAAEDTLLEQDFLQVDGEAYDRFLVRLDTRAQPSERLRQTMSATPPWKQG
jgi:mRNA interferase RelE/StbE